MSHSFGNRQLKHAGGSLSLTFKTFVIGCSTVFQNLIMLLFYSFKRPGPFWIIQCEAERRRPLYIAFLYKHYTLQSVFPRLTKPNQAKPKFHCGPTSIITNYASTRFLQHLNFVFMTFYLKRLFLSQKNPKSCTIAKRVVVCPRT